MRCNINYNKGINQVRISRSLVQECVLRADQFMIIRKIINGAEMQPKRMRPFFFFWCFVMLVHSSIVGRSRIPLRIHRLITKPKWYIFCENSYSLRILSFTGHNQNFQPKNKSSLQEYLLSNRQKPWLLRK